jgi:hypothetical protein
MQASILLACGRQEPLKSGCLRLLLGVHILELGRPVNNRAYSCAGAAAMFPVEAVKMRMQAIGREATFSGVLRSALKHEGLAGLYQGLRPTVMAVTPEKAVMFGVNGVLRTWAKPLENERGLLPVPVEFGIGGLAGLGQVSVIAAASAAAVCVCVCLSVFLSVCGLAGLGQVVSPRCCLQFESSSPRAPAGVVHAIRLRVSSPCGMSCD